MGVLVLRTLNYFFANRNSALEAGHTDSRSGDLLRRPELGVDLIGMAQAKARCMALSVFCEFEGLKSCVF